MSSDHCQALTFAQWSDNYCFLNSGYLSRLTQVERKMADRSILPAKPLLSSFRLMLRAASKS